MPLSLSLSPHRTIGLYLADTRNDLSDLPEIDLSPGVLALVLDVGDLLFVNADGKWEAAAGNAKKVGPQGPPGPGGKGLERRWATRGAPDEEP